ncbi:MAG: calcium/sodium antiporter [Thiohalocapsa sp.]
MTTFIVALIVGFALLIWSADRFVIGAAGLARNLGVAPIIIGLTIVGFGTSAPEMLVSAFAAAQGNPSLAVGNAIGSNIANIALILGATALLRPLQVRSQTLRRELPLLLLIMVAAGLLMIDGWLGRIDGVLLLVGLGVLMSWLVRTGLSAPAADPMEAEFEAEIPSGLTTGRAVLWLAVGLILLLISSRALVWGAVGIAEALGVSDLIIGLTIVAIGTSLPELAASIMSTLKNEADIAIGNIIGSNMFNILGVLALPGLIAPSVLPGIALTRDYPIMLGLTIALFVMSYGFRGPGRINRIEGGLLLAAFVGYQVLLYLHTIGGEAPA